jgi:translation initiation factor IF-3
MPWPKPVRGSQLQAATGAFLVVVGHPLDNEENHISEPRINDRIRVPEVRLVGPNGEQVGIVRVEDALRLAAEADLDLVEVAPNARPPVCKLMDFGKFKYESAMKAREARRNQTNTIIKEIKLRPKIDPHDYGTKKGHVERFLKAGDKVKVTIMFRGREQSRPELGFRLLQRLAEDIGELGFVESTPKQDGRNMIMVIGPTRKKAEAKAEERRRRDQASVDAPTADDAPAPVDAPVERAVDEPVQPVQPVQPVESVQPVEPVEPPSEAAVEPVTEAPVAPVVETPAEQPPVTAPATTTAAKAPAAKRAASTQTSTQTSTEPSIEPSTEPSSEGAPAPAKKAAPRPTAPAKKATAAPAKKAAAEKSADKPASKTAAKTAAKKATADAG